MIWFWLFLLYSFAGYGLEKLFAAATASPQQVRKCFLLLPLCPVYGLNIPNYFISRQRITTL